MGDTWKKVVLLNFLLYHFDKCHILSCKYAYRKIFYNGFVVDVF